MRNRSPALWREERTKISGVVSLDLTRAIISDLERVGPEDFCLFFLSSIYPFDGSLRELIVQNGF